MYRCTQAQAAYSDVATNTTAIPCMTCAHALAVLCFIFQAHLGWERNQVKLYKNLTYGPHEACGYRVKLRQRYMNDVRQIIWKIAIEHTSVKLTYAHPNYHFHFCMCIYIGYTMKPRGLRDLDPRGNLYKHPRAKRIGVYGFQGDLNPVGPEGSSYKVFIL